MEAKLELLRTQLASVEAQAHSLRQLIQETEALISRSTPPEHNDTQEDASAPQDPSEKTSRWPLSQEEYRRYGRQMIMKEVGLQGQLRLKRARVLVVGVGGLGCPAAAYLAGAGVGTLGLLDGDTVEDSNLHRQIAHTTARVGMNKAESAAVYLRELNPSVTYDCHPCFLTASSALPTFDRYDLILDCTDHPSTRYLISDACVLAGKPLMSASALKSEGQLILLNSPAKPPGDPTGGPCYRCIFPKPPSAESVLSCGEGGVLGPVVGTMGVLQAMEAIKLILSMGTGVEGGGGGERAIENPKTTMLMFSAYSSPPFRQVRMRARRGDCVVCSEMATVTGDSLVRGSLDYAAFCGGGGGGGGLDVLEPEFRVRAEEFAARRGEGALLVDVRDATQFGMCALPGSFNVPWTGDAEAWVRRAREVGAVPEGDKERRECYVVCRFGNDSQLAVQSLRKSILVGGGGGKSYDSGGGVVIRDIRGGFRSWRREVDPSWPEY